MSFLPEDFEVPELVETERFRIRPITIHDVVMTSREHLWKLFGEAWGRPPEDLTLEQNLIDLGWHQKEFQTRSSFDYAVMSPDESRLLGCVYVDPPEKEASDADVVFWARADELATGLERELGETVRRWISDDWPFGEVLFAGRDLGWEEWEKLPDR